MKVSVCITTLNEKKSIDRLLDALFNQTKKLDEIIIVDGGSTDDTVDRINKFKRKIKLLVRRNCSIAQGRNLAVRNSKNEIVAMTDAGCVPDKVWLEKITKPFNDKNTQVVAGFYRMTADTGFKKALSVFLGVLPKDFSDNFLPSTRSIAFRKRVWKNVGGFNEKLKGTAEDTDFNYKLAVNQIQIVREKTAVVEWEIPSGLFSAYKKFFFYAKGDAESGIWWNPAKGLMSHNIKSSFILFRYLLGFAFLGFCLSNTPLFPILIFLVFGYFFWAYKKAGVWGIVIQIISDIAVMSGLVSGILGL